MDKTPRRRGGGGSKGSSGSKGSGSKGSSGSKVSSKPTFSANKKPPAGIPPAGTNPGKFSSTAKSTYNALPTSATGTNVVSSGKLSQGLFSSKQTAVALGTSYIGYKAAKTSGKVLTKAYFSSRPRIYGSQAYYVENDDYVYYGSVNEYCDMFYQVSIDDEVMRCDDWSAGNNQLTNSLLVLILFFISWLFKN